MSTSSKNATPFSVATLLVDFKSAVTCSSSGMVTVLRALKDSGLGHFLDCSAELFESDLRQFFASAKISRGKIFYSSHDKEIVISESSFAAFFHLPTSGISSFSEVPFEVLIACTELFSVSANAIPRSGNRKLLKPEFQVLNEILAKSLLAKYGAFDAYTEDRFAMMAAISQHIEVNWASFIFSTLCSMLTDPKQSHGYGVQLSELLRSQDMVFGTSVSLVNTKTLTQKSIEALLLKRSSAPSPAKPVVPTKRRSRKTTTAGPYKRRKIFSAPSSPPDSPSAEDAVPISSVPFLPIEEEPEEEEAVPLVRRRRTSPSPSSAPAEVSPPSPVAASSPPPPTQSEVPEVAASPSPPIPEVDPIDPLVAAEETLKSLVETGRCRSVTRLKAYDNWRLRRTAKPYSSFLTTSTSNRERIVDQEKDILEWTQTDSISLALKRRNVVKYGIQKSVLTAILSDRSRDFDLAAPSARIDAAINNALGSYISNCESHIRICLEDSIASEASAAVDPPSPDPSSLLVFRSSAPSPAASEGTLPTSPASPSAAPASPAPPAAAPFTIPGSPEILAVCRDVQRDASIAPEGPADIPPVSAGDVSITPEVPAVPSPKPAEPLIPSAGVAPEAADSSEAASLVPPVARPSEVTPSADIISRLDNLAAELSFKASASSVNDIFKSINTLNLEINGIRRSERDARVDNKSTHASIVATSLAVKCLESVVTNLRTDIYNQLHTLSAQNETLSLQVGELTTFLSNRFSDDKKGEGHDDAGPSQMTRAKPIRSVHPPKKKKRNLADLVLGD